MRPRWNASAIQQTCNYELLLNTFLRPRLSPTTSGRAMIPRVMNDYPQSGQPMAFLPKLQSPERSFLLHHPRSHFFLELLYQNKIKTTFVYSGELIVGSQAQVMRGRSFVYDESHARSINQSDSHPLTVSVRLQHLFVYDVDQLFTRFLFVCDDIT